MLRDITLCSLAAVAGLALLTSVTRAEDLDEEQEKAIKAAVKKVAPTVVKIETSGGTEVVKTGPVRPGMKGGGMIRRGTGPTTGVIVSSDGYVITSAFNFVNNPSTIRVTLPGLKERKVARVVATDQTRMLTLLKIAELGDAKLPVPGPVAKKDFQIGQTAIAVGRTLTEADAAPSVSVGIISAVDRIWGKAVQTDAKVSPTNYGGPLIDLEGKVQGILVPASPQAEGETAGFEWYDSGIGFAIPLEDIFAVLPRMKKGTDKEPVLLKRGYMGVTMASLEMFDTEPVIGTVAPGSAAEKAGIKPGDVLKSIDGKEIANYAQMLHRLGGKYEGDTVAIKVIRDKEEKEFAKVILGSAEAAYPQAFLGILPIRDDPDPGVEIRYVYPKSAADTAGLKAGDRVMKVSSPQAVVMPMPMPMPKKKGRPAPLMVPITRGRDQLLGLLELARPGQELDIEVKRKAGGKTETVKVKLGEVTDAVPKDKEVPETASAKKALTRPGEKAPPKAAPGKKPETGLQKKQTPAADHNYYVYIPDTYDANVACSVVIWLHPPGKHKERDIEDFVSSWSSYCDDNNIMLVCPINDTQRGWTPGDADFILQEVRTLAATYTLDMRRVVTHGMGVGGEMALYLGFQARTLIHGVAPVGAALGSNPREKVVGQPLSFFLIVGGKDPAKESVSATKEKLAKYKYPVVYREIANMGVEYIDGKAGVPTLEELVRWIDSLDRM